MYLICRGRLIWNIAILIAFAMPSIVAFGANPSGIRLGYFPNITHAQALYGRASGNFEKAIGVPIEWATFNAGPTAIEAIFTGAIDATFVGPGPAINGYIKSRGEKFVIVCGAASGGAALVVRGDSTIKTDKDFSGKTIATPQLGNTQDIAAREWLREKGYRLTAQGGTVNLMALANADQLVSFKSKQIDAAWTIEPWVSRLELEAGGKIFLEEKELWPNGKYVTTHLIVSRAYLKSNPEAVRKLIQATVEATQAINSDKLAAEKLLNQQIRKDTSKALAEGVIRRSLERVELTWDPVSSSLGKVADSAYAIHFLSKQPDLTGIYNLSLLNEVLKEKGLPPVFGAQH